MPASYSQDLRDRVLAAADRGMKTKQIADLFAVSPAWVRRVKQRRRDCGETAPRQVGSPGKRKIDRKELAALVQAHPDATAVELRDRLSVPCSTSAIYAVLKELGYTFKKKQSRRRSRIARTWQRVGPGGGHGGGGSIRGD